MERNLTSGSVLKTILLFSLPYLFSFFLQTLYGLADLFIIGQYNGVASTTAVSIGSQVMHMVTVALVGLAMGSTVMIGRCVGAGLRAETDRAIGNTLVIFMALSLVLTALLLGCTQWIAAVMQTPADAVEGLERYLRICFLGIPFITAYNILSSVFRGMGDSRSPMYFIALACGVNIALDYLFIGYLGLGSVGAALGTTLAQSVSVLVAIFVIIKKRMLKLHRGDFRLRRRTVSELLRVGVPVCLQDTFIQISFLVITVIANNRGLNDAAAVGIVEKIISFLFLVPSSMLSAVSALCAQNLGAQKLQRAKQTLFYAMGITTGFGLLCAVFVHFFSENMVAIFVGSGDAAVILSGGQYLRSYVWDCALAGIHFCFSGYFCACGRSGISFFHNVVAILLARIPLAWLASTLYPHTLTPMGLATVLGSGLSALICIAAYIFLKKRQERNAISL